MRVYKKVGRTIRIKFDYDKAIVNRLKMAFKGATFNPETKYWSVPRNPFNVTRLENLIEQFGFSEESTVPKMNAEEVQEIGIPEAVQIQVVKDFIESDDKFLMVPRDYQYAGITYMIDKERVINGDDMGLGKTGQSICVIEVMEAFPCLVITPANVKFNWEKEWNKWIKGREISVIDGKVKDFKKDVVVINYDILSKNQAELMKIPWASMIVDECHNIKNAKAQRTKVVNSLSKKIPLKFLLSGTAIQNRPSELISPLNILGTFNPVFGNWKKFIYRYCDAKQGHFGLDFSGSSNEFELNEKLRNNCYIRREKSTVAKDIPEVTKQILNVTTTNKAEFRRFEKDFYKYMQETKGQEKADKAMEAEHLVMISEMKRLTVEGKKQAIIKWIESFLEESDDKLVVFGINTAILEELAVRFRSDLIYGATPSKKKLELVERFQTSDKRILFGNIMSLGTGVDGLQQVSSTVLFLQLPDRPADLEQAIARVHRTGQTKPVMVYMLFADLGIDEMMWEVLLEKYKITEAVNKGVSVDMSNVSSMDIELFKKLKEKNGTKSK